MMEVKQETTIPVFPKTSSPSTITKLSANDLVMPRAHSKIIYIYSDSKSKDCLAVEKLKSSLAQALDLFPILAGRLITKENGHLEVDCNGSGALLIVASCEGKIEQLGDFQPQNIPQGLLYSEFTAPELLIIKATYFACGGVILGVSLHHSIADGKGEFSFMKIWAKIHTQQSIPPEQMPNHDRHLLDPTGEFPPGVHLEYKILPKPIPTNEPKKEDTPAPAPFVFPPTKQVLLKFSKEKLEQLKLDALPKDSETWVSTYDALLALIWRGVSRARGLEGEKEIKCGMAINCRSRLEPPLPDSYFGNVNFYGLPTLQAQTLTQGPLSEVAGTIRKSINQMNNSYIRSAIEFIHSQKDVTEIIPSFNCFFGSDYAVTSWVGMNKYDCDFGSGRPSYIGPSPEKFDGLAIFLETPDGNGLQVATSLLTEHMEKMLKDEEIQKYL